MKRCTYCGREYLDEATVCSLDHQPLESVGSPSTTAAPPASNGDLNDEAAAQRVALKQKISAMAGAARTKGASFGEIETELIKSGVDEELIREIMLEIEGKTPQAMAEKNEMEMRHGIYWLLGGFFITVVTYMMAHSSENGGMYVIAWGPVVAGGIQFMRAVLKSNRRA